PASVLASHGKRREPGGCRRSWLLQFVVVVADDAPVDTVEFFLGEERDHDAAAGATLAQLHFRPQRAPELVLQPLQGRGWGSRLARGPAPAFAPLPHQLLGLAHAQIAGNDD